MRKIGGIYFSGTGNTRFCTEAFVMCCDPNAPICSIEDEQATRILSESETIILGYPVYYSNIPVILRDFIRENATLFSGKHIYIVVTMGLFSGDGTGCAARMLRGYGATIDGGLHLTMPDCIGDVKLLKKSLANNRRIVKRAKTKAIEAANRFLAGNPTKDGLGVIPHLMGLLGQRMWFYNKMHHYSSELKINMNACIACGKCVGLCPMQNISMRNKYALTEDRCTMCYRCISHCPTKAITLIGKNVVEQCTIERYI